MNRPTLELSESVLQDLSLFNHENFPLSIEGVEKLADSVCEDIAKVHFIGDSVNSLKRLEGYNVMKNTDSQKLAKMYSSLSTFLMEATSQKLSAKDAEEILIKCKWSPDQIKVVLNIYHDQVNKIRGALKMIGSTPPRIVDVNWRLDYQIESTTQGPINSLLYIITLILDDNGSRDSITFTATHPELEDLVGTLKDACQSVKRLGSS